MASKILDGWENFFAEIPVPDLGLPSEWYNYRCISCNYETEIEDIVVDAYFYSQGCKKGVYPTFTSIPNATSRWNMLIV